MRRLLLEQPPLPPTCTAQADGERRRYRFNHKHKLILSGRKCDSRRSFPDSYPSVVFGLMYPTSTSSQIVDGGVRHDEIKFTGRRGSSPLENRGTQFSVYRERGFRGGGKLVPYMRLLSETDGQKLRGDVL